LQIGALAQRARGQIEQPGADDASTPPYFRDLRDVDIVAKELRMSQRSRFSVSRGRLGADIGVPDNVQSFRISRHKAVFDAVVNHLNKVSSPVGAAMQVALLRRAW